MFKKSKRKKYLINPNFQLSFILFSLMTSILSLSVFYFSINYFFWSFRKMGEDLGIPNNHIFFRFISDQSQMMNSIFVVSALIVLLISFIGALIISHRVAGPIYRMTTHLKQLRSKEEITEVRFRKGDFFIDLQDAFNDFVKNFK